MVHKVHLKQISFSLVRELRLQQERGEMTDTALICKNKERIVAHCAVLATHWIWAYLVRELEWRDDEELVIIMDMYSKLEVEKWIIEAYDNVGMKSDLCFKKSKELLTSAMKNSLKMEPPDILNVIANVKHECMDSELDDIENINDIDDSVVNIAEYLELENLVKQQIVFSQNERPPVTDPDQLKRKVMKDDVFNTCMQALEKSFVNAPDKVRGLPLHRFVFTDINILSVAKAQVKKERIERKSDLGRVSKVSTYVCTVPECGFSSEEGYRIMMQHVMASHMEEKAFKCKDCRRSFTVKDRAFSHIKRTHVDNVIRCLIKEHLKIDTTCTVCGNSFKNLNSLREHVKNVHDKQTDVKCPECTYISKDYLEVRKHRRDVHGWGQRSCDICGKQFTSQVGFDHHMANTHGDGTYPCEDCGQIFKTKRAMGDHRKRKHEEKTFVCDECGAKFHDQFSVKKHKRCHSNEYPYQCNLCDKKCRDEVQLKHHMYKHTGERPYECNQCEATFNQSNALSRHKRVIHSGIRPYPCKLCSFRGGQAYDLVRHIKSVHNMDSDAGDYDQEFKLSH